MTKNTQKSAQQLQHTCQNAHFFMRSWNATHHVASDVWRKQAAKKNGSSSQNAKSSYKEAEEQPDSQEGAEPRLMSKPPPEPAPFFTGVTVLTTISVFALQ